MSTLYSNKLEALRREIEMGDARPTVIDECVQSLLTEGGDNLAADLLSTLSDKAEYDEGMFSLIHAAESLDVAPYSSYVSALLSIFTVICASSPRWTSIVLMRIMNSDATRHELVRQLRDAPSSVKKAVRVMCDQINETRPEFLDRTVAVTLATA